MTIEIPDEVKWLLPIVVGQSWPEGDEDALRRLADAWRAAAQGLEGVTTDGNKGAEHVKGAMEGKTADAFEKQWQKIGSGGEAALPKLKEACEKLGESCDSTALEVEHTKLTIIASLIALAAQIAAMVAAAFGTFGASTAGIPIAQGITRTVVAQIFRQLVMSIAKNVAIELAISVGIEAAVQGIQIASGEREGLDMEKFKGAAISGAIGGVTGGVFEGVGTVAARRAAGGVGDAAGDAVGDAAGSAASSAGDAAGSTARSVVTDAAKEGVSGAAEGAISTAAEQVVTGQGLSMEEIGTGAMSGGATGAAMGGAGSAASAAAGVDVPDVSGSGTDPGSGSPSNGEPSSSTDTSGSSDTSGSTDTSGSSTVSVSSGDSVSDSGGTSSTSDSVTDSSSGSSGTYEGTSSNAPDTSTGSTDGGSSSTPSIDTSTYSGNGSSYSGDLGGGDLGGGSDGPSASSGPTPESPSSTGSSPQPSTTDSGGSSTGGSPTTGGMSSSGGMPSSGGSPSSAGSSSAPPSTGNGTPAEPLAPAGTSSSTASTETPASVTPAAASAAGPRPEQSTPTGGMGGAPAAGGAGSGGASPSSGNRPGSSGSWTGTSGTPGAAARPSTPDGGASGPRTRGPESATPAAARGPAQSDTPARSTQPGMHLPEQRAGAAPPQRPPGPPPRTGPPGPGPRPDGRAPSAPPQGPPRQGPPPSQSPPRPDQAPPPVRPGSPPPQGPPRQDQPGQSQPAQTPQRPGESPAPARSDSAQPTANKPNTAEPGTNQPGTTKPAGDRPDAGSPDSRPSQDNGQRPDQSPERARDAEPGTPERQRQVDQAETTRDQTPGGSSYHDNPRMRDMARRVQDDGVHHTVDAHAGADGRIRIGDNTFSAKEFADMLRRDPNWDGKPIRLLSCESGDSGLARDLANELGVPVTAPRGLAWSDTDGRVFAASRAADGGPTWPPDGGWDTFNPDGTTTPASNDGFHPTQDGQDPGNRPEDAEARGDGEPISDAERKRRKDALPEKYYMYDDNSARPSRGNLGPLRWDGDANNGSGEWIPRDNNVVATAEPLFETHRTPTQTERAELDKQIRQRQALLRERTTAEDNYKPYHPNNKDYEFETPEEKEARTTSKDAENARNERAAAMTNARDAGEDLGNESAMRYLADRGVDADSISQINLGRKSSEDGCFDFIGYDPYEDRWVVVEAKAPNGQLSYHQIPGQDGTVQQGTRKYFEIILDEMEARADKHPNDPRFANERHLARELRKALANNKVDYVEVRAKVDSSSPVHQYGGAKITYFNIYGARGEDQSSDVHT